MSVTQKFVSAVVAIAALIVFTTPVTTATASTPDTNWSTSPQDTNW
jgi:hypothetical protein